MDILDGLNPEQRLAAEHDSGPMLVVAGAGTGKTQVITRRIAYLIASGKAKPNEVLALTFTDRAAREMEERLHGLIGWQSFQVPVMTFHAFGGELLARYGSYIGRSTRGGLLNDTQKALLLMEHLDEVELQYYSPGAAVFEFVEDIVKYIGQLQNAAVTPAMYHEYVQHIKGHEPDLHPRDVDEQKDLQRLYELYESLKESVGAYDFHDQLSLPLEILRKQPNIAQRLRHEYRYVLVDEYQDTNAVQDQLLREIVGRSGNIFAVGDDDQAIYGFRGAEIGNILSFADHFELAQPVALIRNYRSGQPILDAAYRLIRHNDPQRLEVKLGINKRLIGLHDEARVQYKAYGTAADEQQGTVEAIEQRLKNGDEAAGIAVLCATHAPLKLLAKHLRSRGIPYSLSTAVNIFEQPELLSLWYLLLWINRSANDEAMSHVLLGPYFKWSHRNYALLKAKADAEMVGLEEALALLDIAPAREIASQLADWRNYALGESVTRLVYRLVFESDVGERWRGLALVSGRMVQVFEDLGRWLEHMQDFESVTDDPGVAHYLSMFPRPPQLEIVEPVGDASGVSLLTVHAAKGLEYESVYLIGCTQRSWSKTAVMGRKIPPALLQNEELSPEHEYRRLFYVALTRARTDMVVSSATKTSSGSRQLTTPFVEETFGDASNDPAVHTHTGEKFELLMSKIQQYYPLKSLQDEVRPRYIKADGWIELGVTALAQYDYCPFEFYVTYGLGLVQPIGPQLSFGTALHRVFELYYRAAMAGQAHAEEYWQAMLDEQWSYKGYEQRTFAEADLRLAHDTLSRFLVREGAAARRVVGVEVPIRLELPEAKLRLRGKIDAIFESSEGISLRDYKTGRTKTDTDKLAKAAKDNFQLRTYALAYAEFEAPVSEVVLDYVVTDTEGIATLSPAIMRNHRAKLIGLAEKIRRQEFAPAASAVHQCSALMYYGSGETDDLAIELMRSREATS